MWVSILTTAPLVWYIMMMSETFVLLHNAAVPATGTGGNCIQAFTHSSDVCLKSVDKDTNKTSQELSQVAVAHVRSLSHISNIRPKSPGWRTNLRANFSLKKSQNWIKASVAGFIKLICPSGLLNCFPWPICCCLLPTLMYTCVKASEYDGWFPHYSCWHLISKFYAYLL